MCSSDLSADEIDNIASLYYNKAQLLFKLGRYDEAIATMIISKQEISDFYLATLLLRLGRSQEVAYALIENILNKNRFELNKKTISQKKKLQLAESIAIMLQYKGEDASEFYEEIIDSDIINEHELTEIKNKASFDLNNKLQGLWPN